MSNLFIILCCKVKYIYLFQSNTNLITQILNIESYFIRNVVIQVCETIFDVKLPMYALNRKVRNLTSQKRLWGDLVNVVVVTVIVFL